MTISPPHRVFRTGNLSNYYLMPDKKSAIL
jgi:hypothetical protein